MGKSLIIVGGNFQQNGITDLADWVEISSGLKISGYHRQYLHYPESQGNISDQFMYNANALATITLCAIDVSAYVGKRIKVYWSQQRLSSNYTGGAWWRCFASAVASGITFPWNGTSSVQNACTAVERISGDQPAGTTMVAETSILTVPSGSRYLIFSNNTDICAAPRVWVENV